MKLRTSFFNGKVLLKNLTRFAPVWVLYAVAGILFVLTMDITDPGWLAQGLMESLGFMAIFRSIHALIVAACLFGDLFDSRMCNGLHAMPMRRDGWLATNLLSGLAFALIPSLASGGLAALLLEEYAWVALIWQGTNLLFFLFFFAVATFCAMCSGKRLGMISLYALLNFGAMLIFSVVCTIYQPLLYGVVVSDDWFNQFCPLVNLVANNYVESSYIKTKGFVISTWFVKEWNYLWICTGVGAVLYGVSFVLYRKRKLETAGDFLSFRIIRFFFLVAYTFALGIFLYVFGNTFTTKENYLFLAVGTIIGYFTGRMLLERTVKVFTGKVFLGFLAFAALLAGSIGVTIWDPLGVQRYIPPTEKIACASLYPEGNRIYQDQYMDYQIDRNYSGWYITAPEEITQVQNLHSQILSEPNGNVTEAVTVDVQYQLKNGIRIYRSYQVSKISAEAKEISEFLVDIRPGVYSRDWEIVAENIQEIRVYDRVGNKDYEIREPEQQKALLEALSLDAQAGTIAQSALTRYQQRHEILVADIEVCWRVPTEGRNIFWETIKVYQNYTNATAFLEALQ